MRAQKIALPTPVKVIEDLEGRGSQKANFFKAKYKAISSGMGDVQTKESFCGHITTHFYFIGSGGNWQLTAVLGIVSEEGEKYSIFHFRKM